MLYLLLVPLADDIGILNVFRYLTFRTGAAIITALAIGLWAGPKIIRWLKSKQGEGQPIRSDGPQTHLAKKGTPTMGGVMILLALVISTLLWANLSNGFVWVVLFVTLTYGLVGFGDDFLKLTKRNTKGLSGRQKLIVQFAIALIAAIAVQQLSPDSLNTQLAIPFFKDVLVNLGWFFLPMAMLVMVGASNAVNLTDGLDGLAIVPICIVAACFALIAYLAGNAVFADYLQILHVPGTGELAVFCGALIGAGMGFLWYNAPPASVFMGDTGSLACGGALGAIAVAAKHELVLVIIGGLFVAETVSVILQVGSYKLRKKRIFKMAPLHHHFEQLGWAETKVTVRFWIVAVVLALIGLSTLKLR